MTDYDLYYWPLPFRGQFLRAILAFAGKTWHEFDASAIGDQMQADPAEQPVPFMAPPLLVERSSGFAVAQMPAIAVYLASTLGLMPTSAQAHALAIKVINDANDVLDEITLDGGRQMWSSERWRAFEPRLKRWMAIWEATGARHDLGTDRGHLLGTDEPCVADIVTSTLWSTMAGQFSSIREMLEQHAPRVWALSQRLQARPTLRQLAQTTRQRFGDVYCGGQIEQSLRRVIQ